MDFISVIGKKKRKMSDGASLYITNDGGSISLRFSLPAASAGGGKVVVGFIDGGIGLMFSDTEGSRSLCKCKAYAYLAFSVDESLYGNLPEQVTKSSGYKFRIDGSAASDGYEFPYARLKMR